MSPKNELHSAPHGFAGTENFLNRWLLIFCLEVFEDLRAHNFKCSPNFAFNFT
jgi:hypothetical protein